MILRFPASLFLSTLATILISLITTTLAAGCWFNQTLKADDNFVEQDLWNLRDRICSGVQCPESSGTLCRLNERVGQNGLYGMGQRRGGLQEVPAFPNCWGAMAEIIVQCYRNEQVRGGIWEWGFEHYTLGVFDINTLPPSETTSMATPRLSPTTTRTPTTASNSNLATTATTSFYDISQSSDLPSSTNKPDKDSQSQNGGGPRMTAEAAAVVAVAVTLGSIGLCAVICFLIRRRYRRRKDQNPFNDNAEAYGKTDCTGISNVSSPTSTYCPNPFDNAAVLHSPAAAPAQLTVVTTELETDVHKGDPAVHLSADTPLHPPFQMVRGGVVYTPEELSANEDAARELHPEPRRVELEGDNYRTYKRPLT